MQDRQKEQQPSRLRVATALIAGLVALLVIVTAAGRWGRGGSTQLAHERSEFPDAVDINRPQTQTAPTSRHFSNGGLTVWWDGTPTVPSTSEQIEPRLAKAKPGVATCGSNIHPADYSGPESCRKCHRKNYDGWSKHSHRWMNALATEATVKGNFSEGVSISYMGGRAKFLHAGDGYRMELMRDSVRRLYDITQTIGSRFFQYYVGTLIEGPEKPGHRVYNVDQVLPFGYWLDRQEWVPVVHVGLDEAPDAEREDPFARNATDISFSPYYECNSCHVTFALGDELTRNFWALGRHPPLPLQWSMSDYLDDVHQELAPKQSPPTSVPNAEVERLLMHMQQFDAPDHAVALGVTCEACHLGGKEHAEGKIVKPSFFPYSPHLYADTAGIATGPNHENVNWVCGRCHAGQRPYYAGGMSTWNSTEYTDATKGGCYSQLTCIHCHNPHEAIGPQWTRTASQDDASCLQCHQQYESEEALVKHTHHLAGGEGSRCMNCHMPRINEGLQDVVRTHMIFSPTKPEMVEANHPNACNLCHVEQPIDWTLKYLEQWYGSTYSSEKLAANYPHRKKPAVVGWLKSSNEAVRLVAAGALGRRQDTSLLSELIDVLDDPYLLNRQFARVSIERKLDVELLDFGYRFYMTPEERRQPLARIRAQLLKAVAEN